MKSKTFKILVANGVNLDLLGQREPGIYGTLTLADIVESLKTEKHRLEDWFQCKLELTFFQSNHEGVFLDYLSTESWHAYLLNPGAWTHTSLALADRLKSLGRPYVEVHISNLAARESYRHNSFSAASARGVVYGFGPQSYLTGLFGLVSTLVTSTEV